MAQCSCSAENTKYQGVKNHFCAKLVVTPPGVRNKLSPIFKTSHLHEINLNQTLENLKKLKNSAWMKETVDGHLLSWCHPFWMAAITQNHKNDYHGFTVQNWHLQQTPSTTKFGSIFNLNMLPTILGGSRYQKSQKWLPWLHDGVWCKLVYFEWRSHGGRGKGFFLLPLLNAIVIITWQWTHMEICRTSFSVMKALNQQTIPTANGPWLRLFGEISGINTVSVVCNLWGYVFENFWVSKVFIKISNLFYWNCADQLFS